MHLPLTRHESFDTITDKPTPASNKGLAHGLENLRELLPFGRKERLGQHRRSKSDSDKSLRYAGTTEPCSSPSTRSNSPAASLASGSSSLDFYLGDWARRGFETLPVKPGYRLVSLWSTPSSSLYSLDRSYSSSSRRSSSSSSPWLIPTELETYGRFIPGLVSYRLEYTGPVPLKQSIFDVTEINPALLQEGDYEINLKWLSDASGEFVSLAATKELVVKSKKRVLAKSTGVNHVKFHKSHGPCSLVLQKEGWMYRAKDRRQEMRVTIDYTPPIQWSVWSDAGLSMSPWSSPANSRVSSRRSSVRSNSWNGPPVSIAQGQPLPAIPASPAVNNGQGMDDARTETDITSSVPFAAEVVEKGYPALREEPNSTEAKDPM